MTSGNTSSTTGSCVCGAIRYSLEGPFLAFQYCHCTRCRKKSGSAHAANLFVAAGALKWLDGEERLQRYDLEDAKYWSTCFCDRCGSAMPWLTRTGKAFVVPAGSLDEDPGERPTRNIYFASRAPWYVAAAELETYDEFPPKGS